MQNYSPNSQGPNHNEFGAHDDAEKNHCKYDYVLNPESSKNIRVLQRNTIYIIGLKKEHANNECLTSQKYFGQFGEIIKISIKKAAYHNKSDSRQYYSAYINYLDELSACLAIISVQSKHIKGMEILRVSYATSNYCKFYTKKMVCRTKGCSYFHFKAAKSECVFDIHKKSSVEVFDAMLTKAFDAVALDKNKFFSLIKFLEIRNGNFLACQPTAQDALRYLKNAKYCGTRSGNYDKDDFIGKKILTDQCKTNDKSNSDDSEFLMMQALEEELSQLSLDKSAKIKQYIDQKIFNKTFESDFRDIECSNILNAQDYSNNLCIKDVQNVQNYHEAMPNFDNRANVEPNLRKMKNQNNAVLENYQQMYENYIMQDKNAFQQKNDIESNNEMNQNKNAYQQKNDTEFNNEMNQNRAINYAQMNQNNQKNCDLSMQYNYDQYAQNTYGQVQPNMTDGYNSDINYTPNYVNGQSLDNENNYHYPNYSNQNNYYNEVPNQFQDNNGDCYMPQNYSNACYENQGNYASGAQFDQYGSNSINPNTCYANNENSDVDFSSKNQTNVDYTNYYANQNVTEQQPNYYYMPTNGNIDPTMQFDRQINNKDQEKTFSNYDGAQMLNTQRSEHEPYVSQTRDIVSQMPYIRQNMQND